MSSSSKYAGGSHRFNIFRLFEVFLWVRSKYRKFRAQESSKTARFLLFCNAQSTENTFLKMRFEKIELTFIKFEKLHFGYAEHEFIRFINSLSNKLWRRCSRCGSSCCCSCGCSRCSSRGSCCCGRRCGCFRLNDGFPNDFFIEPKFHQMDEFPSIKPNCTLIIFELIIFC